jgi:bifunctional N-acetylglucosamine-1-phosphate-uridyltransferase/glucosamine-1-phosphate-acetyltransferase GlmU-like protein
MNILILAAGKADGEDYPLCLTEFNGIPLMQRVVTLCEPLSPARIIFALRDDEVVRHHLENVVNLLAPSALTLRVMGETRGAACTALLASGHIDNDEELIILNGNELIDEDFLKIVEGFRAQKLDAGTVTFSSVHPRYSYVRLNSVGVVVEAREKNPISRDAVAGFFWYRKGSDLVRAVQIMIRKDARVNGNFYISPAFNEMVLQNKRIGVFKIDNVNYHPLKNFQQIERFETIVDR